jgi:hypothetical protein
MRDYDISDHDSQLDSLDPVEREDDVGDDEKADDPCNNEV